MPALTMEDLENFEKSYTPVTTGDGTDSAWNIRSQLSAEATMDYISRQTANDSLWTKGYKATTNGLKGVVRGSLQGVQAIREYNINEERKRRGDENWKLENDDFGDVINDMASADILKRQEVKGDTKLEQFGLDLMEAAGQLAGQAAIAMATGGASAAGVMGLQIMGEEYSELREKGVDTETAFKAGLTNAAIQAPMEYLGLNKIMKRIPANTVLRKKLMMVGEKALTEGLTEFLQEYPEQATKLLALNKDMSDEEKLALLKERLPEMTKDAAYSGTIGAILGGGAGGAHIALSRSIDNALEREVHAMKQEEVARRVENIKNEGVNPEFAAEVINENTAGERVYVEGESLMQFAQEGKLKEVAESLGVTEEEIKKAAENSDSVDILLGNYEATAAKYDGFLQSVQDGTAFDDGGYTVNQDKRLKQEAQKAVEEEQKRNDDLQVEKDRLTNELLRSGMSRQEAQSTVELLAASAMIANPENPAAALNVSYQNGAVGAGFSQARFAVNRVGVQSLHEYSQKIKELLASGTQLSKVEWIDDKTGIKFPGEDVQHAENKHNLTASDWKNIQENISSLSNLHRSKKERGRFHGQMIMGQINSGEEIYYCCLEFTDAGEIIFNTAAKENQAYIDDYMKTHGSERPVSEEMASDSNRAFTLQSIQQALGIVNARQENSALYQILGEKGAAELDRQEEVTIRLDNLAVARQMEEAGKDAQAIKLATGWERGADNLWKYEIDDNWFALKAFPGSAAWREAFMAHQEVYSPTFYATLNEILLADDLFKAYPALKNVKVKMDELGGAYGEYTTKTEIFTGKKSESGEITLDYGIPESEVRNVLLHEVQHAIQDIEGFAEGANPNMFSDMESLSQEIQFQKERIREAEEVIERAEDLGYTEETIENGKTVAEWRILKSEAEAIIAKVEAAQKNYISPEEKYRRSAGEVEARNVQRRMGMSWEDRQKTLLKDTEDVAREDQIFLRDGEQSFAASSGAEVKGAFSPQQQDGKYIISLFKGADASTVIHETGHFFVERMWQSILDGTASEQVNKDFDTLLEYGGMTREAWAKAFETGDVNARRQAHERIAEGFETYIMEGRAPTHELRNIFRRFSKWLTQVYSTISRNENAIPLTDEVREVFDRMLVAQETIEQEARINKFFDELPKVITDNISDATKDRINSFIEAAQDKAVEKLTREALRGFSKKRRAEMEEYRTEILPQAEQEVNARRVYKSGMDKSSAGKYLKLSEARESRELTAEEEQFILQSDLKAEELGYSSTDEMIRDIKSSPTKEQAVKRRADELVKDKYPDIMKERQAFEEATREALYNDDTGLLIGVERQLIEEYARRQKANQQERDTVQGVREDIERASGKKPKPINQSKEDMRMKAAAYRQQARNLAISDLSRMSIADAVRVQKYATAERRAAAKAAEALARKNYQEALTQKNMQAYYHAMVQESIKLRRYKQQTERFLKQQLKSKRDAWVNEKHYAEVSRLFERMGLARTKHKDALQNRQYTSLKEYAEDMQNLYDCVDIPDWLMDERVDLSNTNTLTLEQYQDVINTIKNIKAIAKAEKGAGMFGRKEAFADLKNNILANLADLPTVFTPDPNAPTKATVSEKMLASMENSDTFFERMDKWTYGYFSKTFGEIIKHSNDKEFVYLEQYREAVLDAYKKWLPDKAAEKAASEKIYYEELGTSVTKHILVKMLMNMANAENTQRLTETCPEGFKNSTIWVKDTDILADENAAEITKANLLEFLGKVLTEEDIAYAQAKVDAAGMFWGEKNELEKRVKGFGMGRVEATPQLLTLANGKQVVFRGGYFPLMRNGEMGSHSAAQEIADDAPLQGVNVRTNHTNTSASKKRTQGAKYPVNLFEGAENQWIEESIHDLCWREAMNDFRRVLNDEQLFQALKTKLGVARMQVFKEMLEKAAQPNAGKSAGQMEQAMGDVLSWLRAKTGNAVIMFNIKINLQNLGNILLYGNSIEGFTHRDVLHAIGNYALNFNDGKSYAAMTDFIFERSPFMRERMTIPDITVRDIMHDQAAKQSEFEKTIGRVGARMMAYTDGLTAKPVWMEAYSKKIKEGATEPEAIDFADTVIRRTLGSTRITDVSSLQRGGPIFKLLTMFQGFFNTQYNQWVREGNIAHKLYTEGQKKEAFERLFAFATAKFFTACVLNLALALENPFDTDDDDGYLKIVKEMKSYAFGMGGPIGQFASVGVGKVLGMKEFDYRMSVVQSSMEKILRTADKARDVWDGKREPIEGAEVMTDVAGLAFGVPAQFNRLLWNFYDVVINDMTPHLSDLTHRRPKNERKRDS